MTKEYGWETDEMLTIRKLETREEIETCAKMMANSEPWITLGRDYEASLATLLVPTKEIYIGWMAEEIAGFLILNMQGAFVGYIQSVCISPAWRGKGLPAPLITVWSALSILARRC